jgi:hypothetical protein
MFAWIPWELVAGTIGHILGTMDFILPATLWSWRRLSQEYLLGGKDGGCAGLPIV